MQKNSCANKVFSIGNKRTIPYMDKPPNRNTAKKEIKVKTFQVKSGYAIVVNDFLRIENIGNKFNSFSFYMNDKMRYEKVKDKNDKLKILPSMNINITEPTDILINGLGFIRVTKPGDIKVNVLDAKLVSKRKSMI